MKLVKLSAGGRLATDENRYLSKRYELIGVDSVWNPLLVPYVTEIVVCAPYDNSIKSEVNNLNLLSAMKGVDYFLPSISEDALFLSLYREDIEYFTGANIVSSDALTVWKLMDKRRFPDELNTCGLGKFLLEYLPDSYPQIVKPRNGVGGKGIKVIYGPDEQVGVHEVAQNYDADARILSSENVFDLEGNLLFCIPFFVQEVQNFKNKSFISRYDENVVSQIREMLRGLIDHGHKFQGCVNVDFILLSTGEIKVIDFNVRRSGFHVAVLQNGLNYYKYLEGKRNGQEVELTYDYPEFQWEYNWSFVHTDAVKS